MLHIIILNKGYFPEKLRGGNPSKDKVVVLAMASDSIPVSAYQNDMLRNMEVKLLPDIKNASSAEGKGILRIAQAMIIGKLTASEKEYEIYSDDAELINGISVLTGKKTAPKKTAKKPVKAEAPVKEVVKPAKADEPVKKKETAKETPATPKKKPMVSSKVVKASRAEKKDTKDKIKQMPKKVDKPVKKKAEITGKLPTQAQIKKVIGAANSGHAKLIHTTLKNSNQITFEMNARMELAKAGLDAGACQELAKILNDEFGKMLPTT